MALHDAREALAHRGAGDVDDLAHREHVDFQLAACRQGFAFVLAEAELFGRVAGGHIRLGEVAGERLRHPRRAADANGDLNAR